MKLTWSWEIIPASLKGMFTVRRCHQVDGEESMPNYCAAPLFESEHLARIWINDDRERTEAVQRLIMQEWAKR